MKILKNYFLLLLLIGFCSVLSAGNIAYIYGDVSDNGNVPSGSKPAFHQMLLTDSGNRGLSQFRSMVESQGHTINQYYDRSTTLNASFLNQFDAVIFGLHQKRWSTEEKNALDTWIKAGGGTFFYSDSAAGGFWQIVGGQNSIGQRTVNNVITRYGMQVLVDQTAGVTAYRAGNGANHPVTMGRPVLEGEGVSPVVVNFGSGAEILIPYSNNPEFKVSGNATINNTNNISINNDGYAALAYNEVGNGAVMVMFDRQAMWNNGEGSDINKRDNKEILRRIVNFLVEGGVDTPPCITTTALIEAECFDDMFGIQTEPSSEGTENIGFINDGDWTLYKSINLTSVSSVKARVASPNGGTIEVRLDALNGELLASIPVTNTGGWQTWATVQTNLLGVVDGVHDIYLSFKGDSTNGGLFNLNWFGFSEATLSTNENETIAINTFPNPVTNTLSINNAKELSFEIYNSLGQLKYKSKVLSDEYTLDMSSFSSGIYFLKTFNEKTVDIQKIIKK